MKKRRITAGELMAKLNADPEHVARRARSDEHFRKLAEEDRRAEAPLVEELRAAGYAVDSVWDLVNTPGSYPAVMPILLSHLRRPYPPAIREGIARALAVPESKGFWSELVRLYREEVETRAKDGLGVALAAAGDDEVLGDVVDLLRDTSQGPSRIFLLGVLERSAEPRARAVLMALGTDPDLRQEVQQALRRLARRQKRRAR